MGAVLAVNSAQAMGRGNVTSFNLSRNVHPVSAPRWTGRTWPAGRAAQRPTIAEIRDDSPLVTVALHRLLLAILHRCYQGPKKPAERVAIRKAGASMPTVSRAYFAEVGRSV